MVIAIIAAITAFFAVGVFRIHQDYGFNIMLSDSSDVVQTMNEAEEKFGGIDEERVLVEAADVLDGTILRKVAGYRAFLEGDPDIWDRFIVEVTTPLDSMVYMNESAEEDSPRAIHPASFPPLRRQSRNRC